MRIALVPVLVVVILPGLWLLDHAGLLRRRLARGTATALGVGIVLWSMPWDGVSLGDQKNLLMLLCAGVCGVLVLWAAHAWNRGRATRWLAAIAALAAVSYVNFGACHGDRTWIHLHDVAHYYLGAKYFPEVGYDGLYVALLRAEAEHYDDHFHTLTARDLRTNRLVDIRQLLQASEPVKARFTPARWRDFTADMALFRDRLGPLWAGVLADHGYNATPPFTLVAGALANRVPAGSRFGVLLLTLLDPLLILAALAAAGWAFGPFGALVAALHFCLVYGAGFAWTGGSFARFGWFLAVIAALACLQRERWRTAGALLAIATALRVFPAALAAGVVAHGIWVSHAAGRLSRRHGHFAAAFAVTLALLVGATALAPDPLTSWAGFGHRMQRQVANLSPNLVGLTQLLALRSGPDTVTQDELSDLEARRQRVFHWQLVVALPIVLGLCLAAARRREAVEAALLGIPMLLAATNLASYDGVLLVGLTLAWRHAPRALALIFGTELATYVLALFADRDAVVFAYRTLLLVALLVALYSRPHGEDAAAAPAG